MTRRNQDPMFDREQIENNDPMGEETFEEEGFLDDEKGRPLLSASDLDDGAVDKRPGRKAGQKVAGIPEERQHEQNTSSLERPDTQGAVIRERGGDSKGDPAVGGTRPT